MLPISKQQTASMKFIVDLVAAVAVNVIGAAAAAARVCWNWRYISGALNQLLRLHDDLMPARGYSAYR